MPSAEPTNQLMASPCIEFGNHCLQPPQENAGMRQGDWDDVYSIQDGDNVTWPSVTMAHRILDDFLRKSRSLYDLRLCDSIEIHALANRVDDAPRRRKGPIHVPWYSRSWDIQISHTRSRQWGHWGICQVDASRMCKRCHAKHLPFKDMYPPREQRSLTTFQLGSLGSY